MDINTLRLGTTITVIKMPIELFNKRMTIVQNNGSAQEVKHFHTHLIPRYHDDGLTPKYSSDNLLPLDVVYTKLTKK